VVIMTLRQKPAEQIWSVFNELVSPSDKQLEQFQQYASYLMECNKNINLTAIRDLSGVVRQHFLDSLALGDHFDMSKIQAIADIGSGAGFPGIPLKIMYPHLHVRLIEVTKKKQDFLLNLIKILGLEGIEVCDYDWRTFLRKTTYDIDCFVTRAALDEVELSRMFKPSCPYKDKTLIYWASKTWEPDSSVASLVERDVLYKLGFRQRRLIFMKKTK